MSDVKMKMMDGNEAVSYTHLAVFGGGYMLTLYHDGKVFFHYPDGAMGAETDVYKRQFQAR